MNEKPIYVVDWNAAPNSAYGDWQALTVRLTMGWAVKAAGDYIRVGTPKEDIRIRNTETDEISIITAIA